MKKGDYIICRTYSAGVFVAHWCRVQVKRLN